MLFSSIFSHYSFGEHEIFSICSNIYSIFFFFALSWCKCVNLVKNRRGEISVLLADKTRAFWADNVCVHACPSYIYTWPKFLVYHRYEGIYSKRRRACALGFLWLRWREGTFLSLRQQQIMCFLPRALRRKWPFSLFYAA